MARAIEETERRRENQQRYNEQNGIVPRGLNKKITDILELGDQTCGNKSSKAKCRSRSAADADWQALTLRPVAEANPAAGSADAAARTRN